MMEFETRKKKVVVKYIEDGVEKTFEKEHEYVFDGELYAYTVGVIEGILNGKRVITGLEFH